MLKTEMNTRPVFQSVTGQILAKYPSALHKHQGEMETENQNNFSVRTQPFLCFTEILCLPPTKYLVRHSTAFTSLQLRSTCLQN